jgi:ComEC/Rec2-related protein
MVRKDLTVPPIYAAALEAAVLLYGASFGLVSHTGANALALIALVVVSAAVAARPFLKPQERIAQIAVLAAALGIGMIAGALASGRIALEDAKPITLADPASVVSVTGTIILDPAPYGPRLYRARIRLASVEARNGVRSSAKGECVVAIPAGLAREAEAGSLRVSRGERVPFAQGLIVTLKGRFAPLPERSREPSLFIVDASSPSPARAEGWLSPLDRARANARISLSRTLFDWGASGGFLFALISGNRDYLDPVLAGDFKRCGLAHVLALSGTHLSLLALVVVKSGRRLTGKRMAVLLSLLAMLLFVWFAGASPSLDRALIFALIAYLSIALGLGARMLPLLALTSLVQMAINPQETVSLAFILSVTALWGIVTFGEGLLELMARFIPRRFGSDIAASFGAQFMTAPVIAIAIGTMAPSGLIASCLIAPLSSVFLLFGAVLLAFTAAFPSLSCLMGLALNALYATIAYPARFFARFPTIEVRVLPAVIAASIIPVVIGCAIVALSYASRKRRSCDAGFARL